MVVTEVEKGRVWFATFLKTENKIKGTYGILRVKFGGVFAIRFTPS